MMTKYERKPVIIGNRQLHSLAGVEYGNRKDLLR
jgi:hypothetical protein